MVLHVLVLGNMSMGIDAYGSCTPAGIIRLIEHYKIDVQGLNAVNDWKEPNSWKTYGDDATQFKCNSYNLSF